MMYAELESNIFRFDAEGEGPKVILPLEIFDRLLRTALIMVKVDEDWYRREYSDVDQALTSGKVRSCKEHYIMYGYKEGRVPYKIEVDEGFYLKSYLDVGIAISEGRIKTAQQHFENSGAKEGRSPYEAFTLFPAPFDLNGQILT